MGGSLFIATSMVVGKVDGARRDARVEKRRWMFDLVDPGERDTCRRERAGRDSQKDWNCVARAVL